MKIKDEFYPIGTVDVSRTHLYEFNKYAEFREIEKEEVDLRIHIPDRTKYDIYFKKGKSYQAEIIPQLSYNKKNLYCFLNTWQTIYLKITTRKAWWWNDKAIWNIYAPILVAIIIAWIVLIFGLK